ncbi:unnamed protein product [Oppiella nova]|uniref:ABC transporter domain-containing protein n=1 Tax=Oppiella nova TaxID=334625 RepID=A0A7R9M168_9ACAR|nr:unnamed protein product [Oppiella nova]CAG2168695.1 unnamed protein product [Oppiella nova]
MENFSYIKDGDDTIERVLNNDPDYKTKDLAVDVRNVVFGYKKKVPVLNKLSLSVPKGKIFALLGPNGTGKTTLIRLILGRLKYSSGIIRVFGIRPGSKHSDIPGPGVGQTVIITTHYIEEARSAAQVAFMSTGVILKQDNPQLLLQQFNCGTLEEVFLTLCVNRNKNLKNRDKNFNEMPNYSQTSDNNNIEHKIDGNIIEENFGLNDEMKNNYNKHMIHTRRRGIDLKRIKTMLSKNFLLTVRRPLYLIVFYVMPLIALACMKLSIGRKPHHIPVAFYNADPNSKLSQLFLDSIEPYYLSLQEYRDNQSAVNSVTNGVNTLALIFQQNFSDTFALRLTDLYDMTDDELDTSQVKVYADFSDSIVGNNVYNSLLRAFEIFLKHLGPTYGHNLYRYFFPITLEPPIYGDTDLNLNVFLTPGLMMALQHVLPMIVSAMQIIYDRKNTSMERVLVAGVKPIEFFIAHVIQNIILITTQVAISMIIAFVILDMQQLGSYVEVYLFLFLQGIQGMAIGLLVALILFDEVSVGIGLTGLMLPLWIVSGVIWPIQSIPFYFRYFADLSPLTQPLESMRSVMLKGWTYQNPNVLNGYIISVVYTLSINKAFSLHLY